jgi:predicted nucleotide-binding protein
LVRTFRADTLDYDRYKSAKNFDRGPHNYTYEVLPHEFQASISRCKDTSVALLKQAIKSLEEQLEEHSANPPVNQTPPETPRLPSRKVFIVHGHEGEPREAVSGFLRKIDFIPVILHEQSNQGRTIVEKFEAHAELDVILEIGYFIGKLGRQNVCAMKLGDLEIPSDIIGVVWTPFDAHGAWKTALAKELRDAGHAIDWNKVMGP